MKKITILAFDSAAATTITGPMDVFQFSGAPSDTATEFSAPFFEVEIVSPDGKPVQCYKRLSINPHRAMHEVEDTDLIIIAGIYDVETTIAKQKEAIAWLRKQYERNIYIAGVCTGVFVLAATGLLDGKDATTHWGSADMFRQLYPKVHLKPERLITEADGLFCSGAFSACLDISLYLVAKFVGYDVAVKSAKTMIHDIGRFSQMPYTSFNFQRNHNDDSILEVQRTLEKGYADSIDIEQLCQNFGMSRRTLERRFKKATGDTPRLYIQRVRVEAAKKILEEKGSSFDEISYEVGYEDSSYFRKIFIKHTGLLPGEYRKKFQRLWEFRA